MPKISITAELARRIEAIIEIAWILVKAGNDPDLIQKTLIDPIFKAVKIREEHGSSGTL